MPVLREDFPYAGGNADVILSDSIRNAIFFMVPAEANLPTGSIAADSLAFAASEKTFWRRSGSSWQQVGGTFGGTFAATQLTTSGAGTLGGIVMETDTNLYRSAANVLKTDDTLSVATAASETLLLDGLGGGDNPRVHLVNNTTGRTVTDGWYFGLGNGDDFNIVGYESSGDFVLYTGGNPHFICTGDNKMKFYGISTPVAQQTGVAVTAAAIHAALVALGLITA